MLGVDFTLGCFIGGIVIAIVSCAYFINFYNCEIRRLRDKLCCERSVVDDNLSDLYYENNVLKDKNLDLISENCSLELEVKALKKMVEDKTEVINNRDMEISGLKMDKEKIYDNNRELVRKLIKSKKVE